MLTMPQCRQNFVINWKADNKAVAYPVVRFGVASNKRFCDAVRGGVWGSRYRATPPPPF